MRLSRCPKNNTKLPKSQKHVHKGHAHAQRHPPFVEEGGDDLLPEDNEKEEQ